MNKRKQERKKGTRVPRRGGEGPLPPNTPTQIARFDTQPLPYNFDRTLTMSNNHN